MKVNFGIIFILPIAVLFALPVKSQVTIGMLSPPLKGAILDLKEWDDASPSGDANSSSGMMMTRVFLDNINSLSPILTPSDPGYDALKQSYTGLVVYNVNATSPLVKGLYIWGGAKWEQITVPHLETKNGLSLANNDTILLGGALEKSTDINFNDFNLILNRTHGNIGIGTVDPQAIMQIENDNSSDPMLLRNLNFATGDMAQIYYKMRISENGVIRKSICAPLFHENSTFVYTLKGDVQETGTGYTQIDSASDTDLTWTKDGLDYDGITLPEDGSYTFSFRFYGHIDGPVNSSSAFYLSSVKNGVVYNTTEMLISRMGSRLTMAQRLVATYTVNVTVTGAAGDLVRFRMGETLGGGLSWWRLRERPITRADRTSMFFWKV